MNWNNLKIGQKLGLGFGVVLLLQAAVVGIGLQQVSKLDSVNTELSGNNIPSLGQISAVSLTVNQIRRAGMNHVLSSAPEEKARAENRMREGAKELAELRTQYERLITSDEQRAAYQRFSQAVTSYEQAQERLLALSKAGDESFAAARSFVVNDMSASFAQVESALRELVTLTTRSAATQAQQAREAASSGKTLMWSMLLAAIVAGIALALAITRSILRPVQETLGMVEKISSGDLTVQLDNDRRDEMGQIQQALNRMAQSLRKLVMDARSATDSISTASSQIASGSQDLSSRTEEAASSLQQTASSMEQLNSTVRQSADSARQAQQLAMSASSSAQRGGEVVSQVVSNMDEITASSRKIADIIGVIDGIAFQTNILALNAAVEAARAGEQGRGFAVVAGEVRNLAQRSAQAAKEIKTLIGSSVEKIESGAKLVDDAGQTMQEIVGSVQRVADIIGEISAATQEQSGGIGQVSQAVSQLDQVTQQNAALVEESAAAADSLREQAQRLAALMSSFRVQAQRQLAAAPAAAALAGASLERARKPAAPAAAAPQPAKPAGEPPLVKTASASAPAAPVPVKRPAPVTTSDDGDWETF